LFGNGGWSWVAQSDSDYSASFIEDFETGELSRWTVKKVDRTGSSAVQVIDNNPYRGTYSLDYQGSIRTWMVSTESELPYPERVIPSNSGGTMQHEGAVVSDSPHSQTASITVTRFKFEVTLGPCALIR
jgi:hypothetical protein